MARTDGADGATAFIGTAVATDPAITSAVMA
jgi:hypothetical protein